MSYVLGLNWVNSSAAALSIFSVTLWLVVPPALVAEQVKVTPDVSTLCVELSHRLEFVTFDSGSVSVQVT
jgi:hypothetical protein